MDGEIFNPFGIITFDNAFLKTLQMNFEDHLFSNKLIIQPFNPVEILYKDIEPEKIELHAGVKILFMEIAKRSLMDLKLI